MNTKVLHLFRLDRFTGGEKHEITPFHFTTEAGAQGAAGKNDRVTPVEIAILDGKQDVPDAERDLTALRALSRLSKAEREALGLPTDVAAALQQLRQAPIYD